MLHDRGIQHRTLLLLPYTAGSPSQIPRHLPGLLRLAPLVVGVGRGVGLEGVADEIAPWSVCGLQIVLHSTACSCGPSRGDLGYVRPAHERRGDGPSQNIRRPSAGLDSKTPFSGSPGLWGRSGTPRTSPPSPSVAPSSQARNLSSSIPLWAAFILIVVPVCLLAVAVSSSSLFVCLGGESRLRLVVSPPGRRLPPPATSVCCSRRCALGGVSLAAARFSQIS